MCERIAEESGSRPCVGYGQDEAKRDMKGFTGPSYTGILAPAKTLADVTAKLQNAVEKRITPASAERIVALTQKLQRPRR